VAATRIVKRMDDLFAIDAEARTEKMDHAARHALRLGKALALLDDMRAQILAAQKTALPKSATGKAAGYTLALWSKLTRFLEHPELELSNNLARELNALHRRGQKELDPSRQRSCWTEDRRHLLGGRELPPIEHSGTRLSSRRAPRPKQSFHPGRRSAYANGRGHSITECPFVAIEIPFVNRVFAHSIKKNYCHGTRPASNAPY